MHPKHVLKSLKRLASFIPCLVLIFCIYEVWLWGTSRPKRPVIIVITPTYKRPERLADMTRFSQTLAHVEDLHWIVIEDGDHLVDAVENILKRSKLPYVYFYSNRQYGFPKRGWTQRNLGLMYVRNNYANFDRPAVVYFADDDNSYDIRVFNEYVRNVKTIGIWAVGLAGSALVEAPRVNNSVVVGFDVVYSPKRAFATDMAGFAINLNFILKYNASFHMGCVRSDPENCFLKQFNITKENLEPFGHDRTPKEVLVWHTKTRNIGTNGERHGYLIE